MKVFKIVQKALFKDALLFKVCNVVFCKSESCKGIKKGFNSCKNAESAVKRVSSKEHVKYDFLVHILLPVALCHCQFIEIRKKCAVYCAVFNVVFHNYLHGGQDGFFRVCRQHLLQTPASFVKNIAYYSIVLHHKNQLLGRLQNLYVNQAPA